MKKFVLPLMATLVLGAMFGSCTRDVLIESVETYVYTKDVSDGEWKTESNYLYASFEWPALTNAVLAYGNVNAYVYENGRQNTLPYLYPMEVGLDDGSTTIVPEQVSFDYERGIITFKLQDLDGGPVEGRIPTMSFRAVATVPVQYAVRQ